MMGADNMDEKSTKKQPSLTWKDLTVRQQQYLQVLFTLDQAKEEQRRISWRTDRVYQNIPAATWRTITSAELAGALGKIPKGERWEAIIEALETFAFIEVEREGEGEEERLVQFRVTKAGRKVVRAGLSIPAKPPHTDLTENQARYARHIAKAGLAPLKEIEAAFLDKSPENEARIKEWGAQLARIEREEREEAKRAYIREHTRHEPCAYPGCSNTVTVAPTSVDAIKTYPLPAHHGVVWGIAAGWHYERDEASGTRTRTSNNSELQFAFYGCCPAHCEAIARMRLQVRLVIDQEEEDRLQQVCYPVALSQDARLEVSDLAFRRARTAVVQAGSGITLPTTPRQIDAEARRSMAALIEEAKHEGKNLTDDLERFRRLFRLSFRNGWQGALAQRDASQSVLNPQEEQNNG